MSKRFIGVMVSLFVLGLIVLLLNQPATVPSHRQSPATPQQVNPLLIKMEPCWFVSPSDWPASECGALQVPEDHFKSGTRIIELPFIIFRSSDRAKDDVPVVVAGGGGPGGPLGIGRNADGVIDESLWYNYASMSVFGGRDLVLIDNRGVGSSVPRLDCPEVEDVLLNLIQTGASESEEIIAYQDGFAACRQRLTEKEGIDISKYNVVQAAHDLETLRKGLGFDSLNLYGVSYGSRVAMVYAREFPDATRALVLDSVYPPHIKSYEQAPRENFRAFERVFEMCADSESCNARFGSDLQDRFNAFLENLDGSYIEWTMTNPRTLKPMQTKIGSSAIVASLYSSMYVETKVQNIPLIVSALMNDSFDYVGELVREEYVEEHSVQPFDEGAYASYTCHGEMPFNDASEALREAGKYPIQKFIERVSTLAGIAMCDAWDIPAGDPIESAPVRSSVPMLLFSGALDPATPPGWATDSMQYLSRAYHIVWPGIAHGVLSASFCADEVAQEFLDRPDRDPTDLSCIDDPPAPLQFTLN